MSSRVIQGCSGPDWIVILLSESESQHFYSSSKQQSGSINWTISVMLIWEIRFLAVQSLSVLFLVGHWGVGVYSTKYRYEIQMMPGKVSVGAYLNKFIIRLQWGSGLWSCLSNGYNSWKHLYHCDNDRGTVRVMELTDLNHRVESSRLTRNRQMLQFQDQIFAYWVIEWEQLAPEQQGYTWTIPLQHCRYIHMIYIDTHINITYMCVQYY